MDTRRSLRERLLGVWRLTDFTEGPPAGPVERRPLGEHPTGVLMYSAAGEVSVQLSRGMRPRFAAEDWQDGTPDEHVAQGKSYLAYAGRFEVEEAESVVVHVIEVSLFPNWVGTRQRRAATFEADRLVLQTPEFARSEGRMVVARLQWQRAEG